MTDLEKSRNIKACEAGAVPGDKINYSENPEITDFSGFKPLLQHSEYYKPVKEQVSIRFNKVLLAHFRAMGKGWQTKINDFLMDAVKDGQIQILYKGANMTIVVNNASKSLVNIIKEIVKLDGASMDVEDDYPKKLISSLKKADKEIEKQRANGKLKRYNSISELALDLQ